MSDNKTALVIEDDASISYLVSFLLEKNGFTVTAALDGKEAMSLIDTNNPPQIVVLDIMLPFFDGFELLAHLRAKPNWKEVPVLMLTAKSQDYDISRAMDGGANDFLVKPFHPMELLTRVKMIAS